MNLHYMKHLKSILSFILITFTFSSFAQEVKTHKARNGVAFDYQIIFPVNYSKDKPYELAMVFSELERTDKAQSGTISILNNLKGLTNMVLVVPRVPKGESDWISHPIHHGLNDLMDKVREQYGNQNQKFHFIGYKLGGRVAQTYSGMSKQYVASLQLAHSTHWKSTKQEYFDQVFNNGFKVYVYDKGTKGLGIDVSKTQFERTTGLSQALMQIDGKIKSL